MKFVVLFLAVLGLSQALPAPRSGLKDDLDDFLALIPTEKFVALYHKYENDPDVQKIVAYLKSDDFAAVMHIIAYVPEVQDIVNYLEKEGVPAKEILNKIADHLELPHWPTKSVRLSMRSSRSIRDFINEAKALIDVDALVAVAMDKLANSEAFQNLYIKISEVDAQRLHDAALSHPEIVDALTRLNNLGIDTKKIWETVKTLFGWDASRRSTFATKGLKDDLDDFLALIPTEKFVALYHKYENDADVKKIVAYLKSKDFAAVMHIIAYVPEVQDIVNYLEKEGVPAKEMLNELAEHFGLPHWPSYSVGLPLRSSRSIRDFINEAKALIDVDALVAVAMDKLANSEAFQNLYIKISEVDAQRLHDAALSHPEIVDALTRLNNLGIDTKKIWETVKTLFGWDVSRRSTFATKGLKDDLDDFLALIPTEKFVALYHKYENDADVKKIVAYLKSKDFAAVMHIIAYVPEVQDIVNYLEKEGVPAKEILDELAEHLGLPHWPSYSVGLPLRSSRSIRDFINEAKALIDVDALVAVAMDKLANSEAFQNLYIKISEVDAQRLHDAALSHPEIVDALTRLNNLGIDTKKIWETVKTLFGWDVSRRSTFATKGLKDDLDDFLALIPTEKFVALYHKYENDADVKKIVAYLKSKDFAAVMHIIAYVPEVQDIVNYLEKEGVPAKEILDELAEHLGLPHWPSYSVGLPLRSSRSIRDFINEAKALIDVDALVAVAMDKLANSEAFQNLYIKISEVDAQRLHDAALSHPEIVDALTRLNNLGIDTKKIWETVKTLFGWDVSRRSTFATKGLKDDLDDFLALIPTEKFVALYHKYENDADVKKIVAYLKSKDFAAVMHIIAYVPEVQDIVNYLEKEGVPAKEMLNELAEHFGLPHWPSYSVGLPLRSSRSIRDFINEAKALIDVDALVAVAMDKLANSEAFQNLYIKISEVDAQRLHDAALTHPEIVDALTRLNNLGIDTKKIWETVKTLFGWE